jgi:glycosyltransferase involved in cell wall biosynthesis
MMRISIYHKSLWPRYKGAIFSQVYQLSQKCGIDISFTHVAETDEVRLALGGVDLTYHQYPFRVLIRGSYEDASLLRRIDALTRDLIKNPVDLVVLPGYDRIENWAMLFVCIILRRKRAVFCDSTMYDRPQVWWKGWAKRLFFAWCDGFVGYGQRSKEYLIKLGANEADIVIPCVAAALPHGYDASKVLSDYSRQNTGTYNPPRFLYVGRLVPEKGLIDLLHAFSLVYAKMPEARLDLIGEGTLRAILVDCISELGLAKAVTLHGSMNLSDIVPQFLHSVALVLPSHAEPWGLVVNESLSYGCPVVVSNRCGCVPELVIEGVTGYCFNAGDIEGLSAAMLAVSGFSEDRASTAKRCIDVVSAFTAERAASRMLEGCTQLLEVRK